MGARKRGRKLRAENKRRKRHREMSRRWQSMLRRFFLATEQTDRLMKLE